MKRNQNPIAVDSKKLEEMLRAEFNGDNPPTVCIESGTWQGVGSTTVIIRAYTESKQKAPFNLYTIESNIPSFEQAKRNLKDFDWVHPMSGMSVDYNEATDFIANDAFLTHEHDLEILVDTNGDMKNYYLTEISPRCTGGPVPGNLLRILIDRYDHRRILFCLDSSGGVGWLEWNVVKKEMGDMGYLIVTDDVNHVKHYRSYQDVMANEDGRWNLIWTDGRVMLAERLPV